MPLSERATVVRLAGLSTAHTPATLWAGILFSSAGLVLARPLSPDLAQSLGALPGLGSLLIGLALLALGWRRSTARYADDVVVSVEGISVDGSVTVAARDMALLWKDAGAGPAGVLKGITHRNVAFDLSFDHDRHADAALRLLHQAIAGSAPKTVSAERVWAPGALLVVSLVGAWFIQRGLALFAMAGGVAAAAAAVAAYGRGRVSAGDIDVRWATGRVAFAYEEVASIDSSSLGVVVSARDGRRFRLRLPRAANEHLAAFIRSRTRRVAPTGAVASDSVT